VAYKIRDGIFPAIKARVVITTGQCLEPQVKNLLECTFDARVADVYACNEAGDIAWQCFYGVGYHVNADNLIVEIVKEGRPVEPGEVGEVVITNLNRYALPIIRYKNGDLARFAAGPCRCGCKLPLLAEIVGRTGEDIFLPDGRIVPWHQLKGLMNHPQVRQYQLIQNIDGSLTIKYIQEKGTETKLLEGLILQRYRRLLGSSIEINVVQTDKIEVGPGGKSKLVVCNYRPGH